MRAYADNEDLALLSGIDPDRVVRLTWIIATALGVLAALAVVAAALYFTFKHGEISTLAFLGFGPPLLVMAGHLAWLRWARAAPVPSAPG